MVGVRRWLGAGALGVVLLVTGSLSVAGGPGVAGGGPSPCGGSIDPGPPTTVPEVPATTIPGTPRQPGSLVAVGQDGALAVVDAATGERVRELVAAPARRARRAIAGVTVSPDQSTVWYDVRPCTPGAHPSGVIYEVPLDGSAPPRRVATGTSPEADLDGGRLAYVAGTTVVVRVLATGAEQRWIDTGAARSLAWLAWTGQGDLVWVRDQTQLVHLDPDAPGARPLAVPGATAGPGEVLYATLAVPAGGASLMVGTGPGDTQPDRISVSSGLAVGRNPEALGGGARDRAWDATHSWGLRSTASGALVWSVGGGTGLIASGYVAVDW